MLLGRAVAAAPTQADLDAARFAGLLGVLGVGPFLELFNRMGQAFVWLGLLAWISIAYAVRRRWDVVALLVGGELSEIAVAFSKTLFDRARPLPMIGDQFAGVDTASYPSGHVTRVLVTLGVLALYATPRRWRPAAIALTGWAVAVMAIARVAVLEHWPTDTLGGVLLGATWLALMGALAPRLRGLRSVRPSRTTGWASWPETGAPEVAERPSWHAGGRLQACQRHQFAGRPKGPDNVMLIELRLEPTIASLGPFSLGWHGLITTVAVVVAVRFGMRSAQRTGHPVAALWSVMTWAMVGGLIGARTFYVIDHGATYLRDPLGALAIWQGGIAVYGAFIGGVAAGVLAARREGLRVWPLLDVAAPAMLVGQAIGRLGCLINGDTWGAPTGAEWGLVYRDPGALLPSALLGVPTHAYPIYEIAATLTLLALLWLLRRLVPHGHLFLLAVVGYAAIRFALTSFRQETVIFGGLQQAQLVAVLSGLAALALLLLRSRTRQHDGVGNFRSTA